VDKEAELFGFIRIFAPMVKISKGRLSTPIDRIEMTAMGNLLKTEPWILWFSALQLSEKFSTSWISDCILQYVAYRIRSESLQNMSVVAAIKAIFPHVEYELNDNYSVDLTSPTVFNPSKFGKYARRVLGFGMKDIPYDITPEFVIDYKERETKLQLSEPCLDGHVNVSIVDTNLVSRKGFLW
jgi:hypothetical protein